MEILGIGPMELILVLIIATVVFGPDKLPEIGAKLGQGLKQLRNVTREFTRETQELREAVTAPVREIQQPFTEAIAPVRDDLAGLAPMAKAVTNPQEALRQAVAREMTGGAPQKATQGASDVGVAAETGSATAPGSPPSTDSSAAATALAAGEPAAWGAETAAAAGAPAETASRVPSAPATPQEALRRAVTRELARTGSRPMSASSLADAPGVTSAGEAPTGANEPAQPVPFFGLPQPGTPPAGATAPAAGASEPGMPSPSGPDGSGPAAPQRVVRLKPRRLNRPYFGRATAEATVQAPAEAAAGPAVSNPAAASVHETPTAASASGPNPEHVEGPGAAGDCATAGEQGAVTGLAAASGLAPEE